MADSVSFGIRDFHGEGLPAQDSRHFHGLLRICLDGDWVEYPQSVCVNDWLKALLGVQREIAFGDRARDPATFFIVGPPGWPVLEAIRMYDTQRIALLQDGEALAKCLVSVTSFQLAVEEHLHQVFQRAVSLGGDPPTMPGHLVRWGCRQFSAKQAVAAFPSRVDLASSQPAAVVCLCADQMIGEPTKLPTMPATTCTTTGKSGGMPNWQKTGCAPQRGSSARPVWQRMRTLRRSVPNTSARSIVTSSCNRLIPGHDDGCPGSEVLGLALVLALTCTK